MKHWGASEWVIACGVLLIVAIVAISVLGPQRLVTVRLDFPPPAKASNSGILS